MLRPCAVQIGELQVLVGGRAGGWVTKATVAPRADDQRAAVHRYSSLAADLPVKTNMFHSLFRQASEVVAGASRNGFWHPAPNSSAVQGASATGSEARLDWAQIQPVLDADLATGPCAHPGQQRSAAGAEPRLWQAAA